MIVHANGKCATNHTKATRSQFRWAGAKPSFHKTECLICHNVQTCHSPAARPLKSVPHGLERGTFGEIPGVEI